MPTTSGISCPHNRFETAPAGLGNLGEYGLLAGTATAPSYGHTGNRVPCVAMQVSQPAGSLRAARAGYARVAPAAARWSLEVCRFLGCDV